MPALLLALARDPVNTEMDPEGPPAALPVVKRVSPDTPLVVSPVSNRIPSETR
jgi:hypothetical protein